jgi:glycosyltransferase involved in cell wall biosynthesis
MQEDSPQFECYAIAVVIPAYQVEIYLAGVLAALPEYIRYIIVVNDCSPDHTRQVVETAMESDRRILLINHVQNLGVGGAMISGFQKALELNCQFVVKMDGDGQMSPEYLPALLMPLILRQADCTKGNRFRDLSFLHRMPFIRRLGNVLLGFLAKAATGYWNCFDPTNGYLALRAEVLAQLPWEDIHRSYFFEISLLGQLYLLGALIREIPMPALYNGEKSSLSITRILFEFPPKLFKMFLRRIVLKLFVYDFSMASVYLLTGLPLLLFGVIFGAVKWVYYASRNVPAPTGTIMLAVISVILGVQLLLAAIQIDIQAVPHEPLVRP